jgi:nitrogen fixation protein FixH
MAAAPGQWELKGRHVLAILVGFFGVVFAVNGYFLYSALSTHTGIVANEPYRKGLAYNSRIDADQRQSELKWNDTVVLAPDGTVEVTMTGPNGDKVAGLVLTGTLGRPATGEFDRRWQLAETAPGVYKVAAGALATGSWLVAIEGRMAAGDTDPTDRARRRLWLKP